MYVMAGIVAFGVKLSGRPRWADALPLAGTGRMLDMGCWTLAAGDAPVRCVDGEEDQRCGLERQLRIYISTPSTLSIYNSSKQF